MRAVKRPHRFQFNENSVLNQQINEVFADQGTLVSYGNPSLLFNGKSRCTQFQRQRIFVNLLQKSAAQRVRHRERAADDPLRYSIPLRPIRVHLRPSVFICVKPFFLTSLPAKPYRMVDTPNRARLS